MKHNVSPPVRPTEELVRAACQKFDEENEIVETALKELFTKYPHNNSHAHVLLKVVALNRLYSTQILAVHDMARHIYQQAQEIDSALAAGSAEIVDKIANVRITMTGKERTNYSFATKYCSWHNQASFPIWDSRVERYLKSLRQTPFAALLGANPDRWERYKEFLAILTSFRDFYCLELFTFKEIDKFLWSAGEAAAPAARR